MHTLLQDLRYGLRMLTRNPGFTAVAVLTLALGIGANTAIFSVVNGVLLRPLPYKDAGRLVLVAATDARNGSTRDVTSYPDFSDWRAQNHVFTGLAAYRPQYYDLSDSSHPERVRGVRVSEDLFTLLEEKPVLGRAFLPEEYQEGKNHVVVLSDGLWRRRFGANPLVIGNTLKLNDETYTVVGVMPPGFAFPPEEHPTLYAPLAPDTNRNHGWLWAVARLKQGTSLPAAQAEMDTISTRLQEKYSRSNQGRGVNLIPLQEALVGDLRPAFLVFVCAVGLVLLIACANVANLMLSRMAARERELAVRAALGAGRARLFRQLLTESTLLSLAGGALGMLLAAWGVDFLVTLLRTSLSIPRLENVGVDRWVLGFTLVVSLLTGVLFGLAPALAASRVDLNESLKEGTRSLAGSLRSRSLRSLLVISEMGLALVLLIGAGLMIKSFLILAQVDSGLDTHHVLALDFSLYESRYSQPPTRIGFFHQVLERVRALPEVRSAAWVADVPLSGDSDHLSFSIAGRPDPGSGQPRHAMFDVISPDYFRTLRIPLSQGRDFSERDSLDAPGVAVINAAMARRFWPNENPLGKQITTDGHRFFSIIGVVGDVRQLGPSRAPEPEVYLSYLQDPVFWPYRTLLVRTAGDPVKLVGQLEQAVWSVNRDQPIANVRTLDQVLASSVAQPRVYALLLGVFAALALVLASVGIYGVVSYAVTQTTHEIGIRMALGAAQSDVLRMVVGQGMALTLAGVAAGLAGAFALTRFLASFLYGVRPTDPGTFVLVSLFLTAVAILASYLPARRATKVDPMVALRYE